VYFLKKIPETVSLPLDLARRDWRTLYILEDGEVVSSAPQATARRESNRVDGQIREGLFFHPPNHGRTVALWTMTLPSQAAQFRAQVGVRDRSRSSGVLFLVEVNGKEVVQKKVLPGKWILVAVDLGPWAGQPIVLSLAVDSLGPFDCDWAAWGEPRIELR
jgi:hypothetical protein